MAKFISVLLGDVVVLLSCTFYFSRMGVDPQYIPPSDKAIRKGEWKP